MSNLANFRESLKPASERMLPELLQRLWWTESQQADATDRRAFSETYRRFQQTYYQDPLGFSRDCITWKDGEGITQYQEEIAVSLLRDKRIAIRGPHGLGKSMSAAMLILWFFLTRDGHDWKVITTASVWRQLIKYLWPEIHKWARRLKWDVIGRQSILETGELLQLSIKGKTGEAFAVASDNSATIEGAHADKMLYVFDEAKSIPDATFDAAEGALSNAGANPDAEAYAMAISTPGEPMGRFYDIHRRAPGYDDWHVRHVKKEEVIAAGRMGREWADQRKRSWGEYSAVYQNRVEGEFYASDEAGVIPLAWIEQANERWLTWKDRGGNIQILSAVGADIAGSGRDKTVFALRDGMTICELRKFEKQDTMTTAGLLAGIVRRYTTKAVVDVVGLGTGVVDRLREQQLAVVPFNNGAKSLRKDRSGELGFGSLYSEAWWGLRESLDPSYGSTVALPPDDELTQELTIPHWRNLSDGRIQVEGKDDSWGDDAGRTVKQRLGRSPDSAEAVIMSFWTGGGGPIAYETVTSRASLGPGRGAY